MTKRLRRALIGGFAALGVAAVLFVVLDSSSTRGPAAARAPASASFPAPAPSVAPTVAPTTGPAAVNAAPGSPCASYPRPGTTVAGSTPANLIAEYGVLGHTATATGVDRLASRWLRSLPVSGIVANGTRFLARTSYGNMYIVSAHHLLAFPLVPDHCLPRAKRAVERSLERQLRSHYGQQALCLVIVSDSQESPICGAAPGTFDPLEYAPGTPGFGIVPDGVAAVRVRFKGSRPTLVPVLRNLWLINDPHLVAAPCGVKWLDATGMVLRTIAQCTRGST